MSITALIFSVWWTNFTASTSDSPQTTLTQALSPVGALTGIAHNAVEGASTFSQTLKDKVVAIQYEASGSISTLNASATSSDIVYPEQIFGSMPKENSTDLKQDEAITKNIHQINP